VTTRHELELSLSLGCGFPHEEPCAAAPLGWTSPENLDQLIRELVALVCLPVSVIDIALLVEIIFSSLHLPSIPSLPF